MAGPANNIPLRAKGYLEIGIGLITTLTVKRTVTLTTTLTLTRTLILTRTLNRALNLTLTLTLTLTNTLQLWEYWSGIIKQIRRAPLLADKWSKNQEQSHLHREYMIGMPPTFW